MSNEDNNAPLKTVAELTDAEIMGMDSPESLIPPEENKENKENKENEDNEDNDNSDAEGDTSADDQAADGESDEGNDSENTGGTDSEDSSSEDQGDGAGDTSTDKDDGDDTESTDLDSSGDSSEDDQSSDQDDSDDDEEDSDSDTINFEVEYKKLMAPFRAAKREVSLNNIDDARRLMQMGVDYSRKMESMKPHMRVIRTLEKAGLLDPKKINFLIDLDRKSPEAIKKLLKDADIDPMTLSNEDDVENYSPTDHTMGDKELAVTEVLDKIKGNPSFNRTVEVITNEMDTKSRTMLQDNPAIIAMIDEHIDSGIYDQVMDRVASERTFGRLVGLSDLNAYYQIGDAMHKANAFKGVDQLSNTDNGEDNQNSAQDSGSDSAKAEKQRKNRKRAASSTKSGISGGKAAPDFSQMSDAEIEKFDSSTLT